LTIFGDGKQTRSFCYVDDLISGIIKMFFADNPEKPINLGNPEPIDMASLASEIIGLTKSNSSISFKPLPQDDPVERLPDIRKAKEILGWSPFVDRETGLKKTIEYFRATI
jgi:nucleoside-diphosphate-sugar epimerase